MAALPQHPDEHRPERPVLLAVDQELRASGVAASSGVGDVVIGTTVPHAGNSIRPSLAVGPDAAGLAFSTRMVCRLGGTGRVSIDRTGDGRVVPGRSTIVRHDRRRCAMVLMRFP